MQANGLDRGLPRAHQSFIDCVQRGVTTQLVTLALQKHQRTNRGSPEQSVSVHTTGVEAGGKTRIAAELELRLSMNILVDAYDLLAHEAWLPMV
jgi:hypothetical protein